MMSIQAEVRALRREVEELRRQLRAGRFRQLVLTGSPDHPPRIIWDNGMTHPGANPGDTDLTSETADPDPRPALALEVLERGDSGDGSDSFTRLVATQGRIRSTLVEPALPFATDSASSDGEIRLRPGAPPLSTVETIQGLSASHLQGMSLADILAALSGQVVGAVAFDKQPDGSSSYTLEFEPLVLLVWLNGNLCDIVGSPAEAWEVSWSGTTVTYGIAPASGERHYALGIGEA